MKNTTTMDQAQRSPVIQTPLSPRAKPPSFFELQLKQKSEHNKQMPDFPRTVALTKAPEKKDRKRT